MASKKQAVKAVEIRELEKTIIVNDNVYNVNAVEADHSVESDHTIEAEHSIEANHAINADNALKVGKNLTINKVGHTSTTAVSFNGSADRTVNIVPAEGGKFTGRIAVPNVSDGTLKANGETVINYNDMVTRVVDKLINASTVATWDNTNKKLVFTSNSDAIKGLCIVKGLQNTLSSFSTANVKSKWLPDYLFVCADSGNIYLGSDDSATVLRLAATTSKLDTTCAITTNLASNTAASFNGTVSSISPGVTGILSVANGGTGKNSLSSVTVGKASQLVSSPTIRVNLASEGAPGFNGTANISPGVTGTLPVSHGGTGATTAKAVRDNLGITPSNIGAAAASHTHSYAGSSTVGGAATKALQDGNGNTITSYYQKKITISSSAPSGGSNGDIWIKY
jgi:urease beta subunit